MKYIILTAVILMLLILTVIRLMEKRKQDPASEEPAEHTGSDDLEAVHILPGYIEGRSHDGSRTFRITIPVAWHRKVNALKKQGRSGEAVRFLTKCEDGNEELARIFVSLSDPDMDLPEDLDDRKAEEIRSSVLDHRTYALTDIPAEIREQAQEYCRNGKKLMAVRLIRTRCPDVSLAQAKDYVDHLVQSEKGTHR